MERNDMLDNLTPEEVIETLNGLLKVSGAGCDAKELYYALSRALSTGGEIWISKRGVEAPDEPSFQRITHVQPQDSE